MKVLRKKKVQLPETKVLPNVMPYQTMIADETLRYVKKGEMNIRDLDDMACALQNCMSDEVCTMGDLNLMEMWGKRELVRANGGAVFSPYSFSQLMGRYGIPILYAKRCLEKEKFALLQTNIDEWNSFYHDMRYLVRSYNMSGMDMPVIRAVLTEKYKTFDTHEILGVMRQNFDLRRNYSVRNYLMNPEKLHIRMVSDMRLDVKDDDLFLGLNIDSSDVGRSSLRISIIVFKQVCTNGLVLPMGITRAFRQIHFGSGAERFSENIAACLQAVGTMKEVAEEVINKCYDKGLPFDVEKEDSVEKFRVSMGISKDAMQKVLNMLASNKYGNINRWSLINCMTEVAQEYNVESRVNIEESAGKLLLVA